MGNFYGIGMPDDQWAALSPGARLKYLSARGGPTGNVVDAIQQGYREHPNWNSSNYFDKVFNHLAGGGGRIPEANVPSAKSGIGMMSGDAGADVSSAQQQTAQNYGPDPRNDYIPPAMMQTAGQAKTAEANQGAREQEWLGHLGTQAGQITGAADAYQPGAGREWNVLGQSNDPTAYEQIRRRRMMLEALGRQ